MKEQKRRFWSAVLLVLLMSVSTGCDRASETLSEWKQDFKQDVAMDDRANTSENRLEVPNPDDITIEELPENGYVWENPMIKLHTHCYKAPYMCAPYQKRTFETFGDYQFVTDKLPLELVPYGCTNLRMTEMPLVK